VFNPAYGPQLTEIVVALILLDWIIVGIVVIMDGVQADGPLGPPDEPPPDDGFEGVSVGTGASVGAVVGTGASVGVTTGTSVGSGVAVGFGASVGVGVGSQANTAVMETAKNAKTANNIKPFLYNLFIFILRL